MGVTTFDSGEKSDYELEVSLEQAVDLAFEKLKRKGKRPNLIYSGGNFLHIAALNAYAAKMANRGVELCGVICNPAPKKRMEATPDPLYISALDLENYVYLKNGRDFIYEQNLKEKLTSSKYLVGKLIRLNKEYNQQISDSNALHLLSPAPNPPDNQLISAAFSQNNNIKIVLYEEGIGTYTQLPKREVDHVFAFERGMQGKKETLIFDAKRRIKDWIDQMVIRKVSPDTCLIFDSRPNADAVLNRENAKLFTNAFEEMASLDGTPSLDYSNKAILVATSTFDENGHIDFELALYKRVIDILHKYEIDIVLRPHPRTYHLERYKELGVEIDSNRNVPLESLIAVAENKPLIIAGLISSSQVNASALWGIESVSLATLFNDEIMGADLFPSLRIRQKNFLTAERIFSKYLVSPASISEFEDLVCNLRGQSG